jgi:hypothetical protein
MARLMVAKSPGRQFKDGYVTPVGLPTIYAYLSASDFETGADAPMLAIDLSYSRTGAVDAMVEAAMRSGREPFSEAEEIQIGPGRYLVVRMRTAPAD